MAPSLPTRRNETLREGDLWTWHGVEIANTILLLIFGIFGNSLVLHVYIFRLPISTVTLIKIILAALDLSAIVVTKTLRIYMLLNPESHVYNGICISAAFFSIWTTTCAYLLLIVIAVDRYLRLCTVHRRGVREGLAKKLCLANLIFCGLIDIPVFSLFGEGTINIPQYGVKVTICFLRTDQLRTTLFYIFYIIYLLFLFATSVILFSLYYKLIRRLIQHARVQHRLHSLASIHQTVTEARASTRYAMQNSIVTFALITVLYIVINCLFMFSLPSYVNDRLKKRAMTPKSLAIHDLTKQSPMYIHIVNPIIYSFTSPAFRKEARRFLLCNEVPETRTTGTDSSCGSRTVGMDF